MRDGDSPEVVMILDTVPELEIVSQCVEPRPTGLPETLTWCRQDYEESMVNRFLTQARIGGAGNPAYVKDMGEGWKENPRFEVLEGDVRWIRDVAQKVVDAKVGFLDFARKSKVERIDAAQRILGRLSVTVE